MPDKPLDESAIQNGLKPEVIGKRVVCLKVVGSTNNWLKVVAEKGEPEGLVVFAEEQTAGHGQAGRPWVAPPSCCILSSTLVRPTIAPDRLPYLTMMAACAAAAATTEVTGLPIELKWPNDLIVDDKKVGGILVESAVADDLVEHAIVGIGINVNQTPQDLASLPDATSLGAQLGRMVDRVEVARSLLGALDLRYTLLRNSQFDAIFTEWRGRLVTHGKWVRLRTASGVEGPYFADRVADNGALVLLRPDGAEFEVVAGEVSVISSSNG
jgi:BirA family biotin operon repressor/biotin-[acetyl-CoA-carboxylase] ligase